MPSRISLDVEIIEAAAAVRRGGVIVYPTDTVYGIGCDPLNSTAVRKVFRIKGRGSSPVPVLVSSVSRAKAIAEFSPLALQFAKKYWPGPLTLVVRGKGKLPPIVCGNMGTVGIRIPRNPITIRLITLCGGYLVGTSANKSGHKPVRTAREAIADLGVEVDYVLEGGPAALGVESTVLDISMGRPKVLRIGPVKISPNVTALS